MGILGFQGKKHDKYSVGITPDRATRKVLDQRDRDTRALFMKFLLDSGRYKEQQIAKLVNRNTKAVDKAITSGKLLELEEKRRLGISGRRKYGSEYVETLTEKGLENDASVDFFTAAYAQAFGIVARRYSIARFKQAGVKRVRISSSHDERDCRAIAKYDGMAFPIDEVPALPLPECDAEYCRCVFVVVLE